MDVLLSLYRLPSAKISEKVSLAQVICHITSGKAVNGFITSTTVTISYQSVPRNPSHPIHPTLNLCRVML